MRIMRFILRFIILKPFSTAVIVGLIALAVLGVLALMNLFKEEPVDVGAVLANTPFVADMENIIPVVFDNTQQAAVYDWALVGDAEEDYEEPSLLESVTFEKNGQSYELVLATVKNDPADEEFTHADYLSLTVNATFAQTTATVVYIDLGADGIIDSAYINDVRVNDNEALVDAQRMYAFELTVARDFMLNG